MVWATSHFSWLYFNWPVGINKVLPNSPDSNHLAASTFTFILITKRFVGFRGTGCSNRRCWREWWLCLFVNEGKWSFEYSSRVKKYYVRISPFSLYPSVSFCSPNPGVWACCSLSQLSQADPDQDCHRAGKQGTLSTAGTVWWQVEVV